MRDYQELKCPNCRGEDIDSLDTFNCDFGGDFDVQLRCEDCDYELLQFTGLKDKKGKEIYEGNIVDNWDIYVVRFGKQDIGHDWQGIGFYLEGKLDKEQYNICEDKELEVIGNIYENKELLKKEGGK